MTTNHEQLNTQGLNIDVFNNNELNEDFISLTGIAKYREKNSPNDLIKNWMRNRSTLEYLGLWEQLNNSEFDNTAYTEILTESGSNAFVMSPTKWIKATNAKGIISKPGRYGGTYAQSDIAFEFATWVSPEFKLYIIKDYQQLKTNESSHLNLDWSVNRTLTKINYKIHTDAIKEKLIPNTVSKKQAGYKYADEADRLNIALFGITAKQWKQKNPSAKGNIRDNATLEQLTVLANLESMNGELIRNNVPEYERTFRLNTMAQNQMETLLKNHSKSMEELRKLQNNNPKRLN